MQEIKCVVVGDSAVGKVNVHISRPLSPVLNPYLIGRLVSLSLTLTKNSQVKMNMSQLCVRFKYYLCLDAQLC